MRGVFSVNFKNIGIFLIGCGVGALVATKMLKQQYEDILQEEIVSIKEVEQNRVLRMVDKTLNEDYEKKRTDKNYKKHTKVYNIKNDGLELVEYDANTDFNRSHPYEITDEDFSESMGIFDKISLFYYADGVLADEGEEMVDDVDRAVGIELLLDWAGDPDKAELLYVRNEKMNIDYEILRMEQPYSEMVNPTKEEE